MGIDTDLISGIAGELQSFASLSKKIKDVDKALGDRVHSVGAIALALIIVLAGSWLKDHYPSSPPPAAPNAAAPPSAHP
jgi:dCTP deaminase